MALIAIELGKLIVGSIPIVKSSLLDELLSGVPVVIVKDWDEINEPFLEHAYSNLKNNNDVYSKEKIKYAYWEKIILNVQAQHKK